MPSRRSTEISDRGNEVFSMTERMALEAGCVSRDWVDFLGDDGRGGAQGLGEGGPGPALLPIPP